MQEKSTHTVTAVVFRKVSRPHPHGAKGTHSRNILCQDMNTINEHKKHHLLHQACTSCSRDRQHRPHPSKRAHPPVVQQRQSPRRIPLLGALMQSMRQRRRSSIMGYKNRCSSATPRTCTSPSDENETTLTRSRVTVRHVDVRPGPHMPQAAPRPRQSQTHRAARCTTGTGCRAEEVERTSVGYR